MNFSDVGFFIDSLADDDGNNDKNGNECDIDYRFGYLWEFVDDPEHSFIILIC